MFSEILFAFLRFFLSLFFWLIEPWQTNGTTQNGGSPSSQTTFTDSLTGKIFSSYCHIFFFFSPQFTLLKNENCQSHL